MLRISAGVHRGMKDQFRFIWHGVKRGDQQWLNIIITIIFTTIRAPEVARAVAAVPGEQAVPVGQVTLAVRARPTQRISPSWAQRSTMRPVPWSAACGRTRSRKA